MLPGSCKAPTRIPYKVPPTLKEAAIMKATKKRKKEQRIREGF
jgi:hypothetical protein